MLSALQARRGEKPDTTRHMLTDMSELFLSPNLKMARHSSITEGKTKRTHPEITWEHQHPDTLAFLPSRLLPATACLAASRAKQQTER